MAKNNKKFLILDSSTVISLSLSDLLFVLGQIKEKFPSLALLISDDVITEIIDRPLVIKRFKLEALLVKKLFQEKVLEQASDYVSKEELEKETQKVLEISNRIFNAKGENITILHRGEASCIALYRLLKEDYEKILLVVDERTTRMLSENPKNLHKLLERKLHTQIEYDNEAGDSFKDIKIARSAELCFFALKRKLIAFPDTNQNNLDAVLYALKYHGCAISREEIDEEELAFNKI